MSSNKSILKWVFLAVGIIFIGVIGLAITLALFVEIADDSGVDTNISVGSNQGRSDISPFVIYAKPQPKYTDAARENDTQGVVRLKVTLLSSGEIGHVDVISPLPDGLTEEAVAAARQIKFTPKVVNGEPVSVIVTIEYGFNIY